MPFALPRDNKSCRIEISIMWVLYERTIYDTRKPMNNLQDGNVPNTGRDETVVRCSSQL